LGASTINRFFQVLKRVIYITKKIPSDIVKHIILSFAYTINSLKGIKITSPPIFVVGCGHSGTSLLLSILGSHSELYPVPKESGVGFKTPREAKRLIRHFNFVTIAKGKKGWIEKTPKHINSIDSLFKLSSNAKVLLILRDGRDVAYSIKKRTGSVKKGIQRWVKDNKNGERYWSHPRVYVLKYEDLVKDFDTTIRGVLKFIRKKYESNIKNYYKKPKYFYSDKILKPEGVAGRNHNINRNWQINQPLFDGRGKWKNLSKSEKKLVKSFGNEMLIKYNYVSHKNW
jgi:hypothetical protein